MDALAKALEQARLTRSRLAKIDAIAGGLRAAAEQGSEELAIAARLAMGRALPPSEGRVLGVGWRLVFGVASALTGASEAEVGEAMRRHGDLGDAVFALYEPLHAASPRPGVSLREFAELAEAIAATGARGDKSSLLLAFLSRATPLEAKYVVKALLGELRTGAVEGVLIAAVAKAFDAPLETVKRAVGLLADPAEAAVLAREGRLAEASVRPGRPLAFMLATPRETIATPLDWPRTMGEDKLDGVRAQVHVSHGDVAVFGRGLENVTAAFPEIARAFRETTGDAVLDGEIVAVGEDGRVRPFQALQARLNRVTPDQELLIAVPATFVAFDLLVDGEQVLVDRPWFERRRALEAYAHERGPKASFSLNASFYVGGEEEIDAAFDRARARGHEGLVLKRTDSLYEAGRRGQSWIKVKKALATLDVVVTAVEEGHGKRAGMLSDYTFAVWREDGTLVNVGKAYSGLTDAEIAELAQVFMATTREERRGRRIVEPTLVIEVGFDGIQRSSRHPSGFALRFPRILRIRRDKRPEDADTVATVEDVFRSQVASGHREEPAPAPATTRPKKRLTRAPSPQLSLFGDDDPSKRRDG